MTTKSGEYVDQFTQDVGARLKAMGYGTVVMSSLAPSESDHFYQWGVGFQVKHNGETKRHAMLGSDDLTTERCAEDFAKVITGLGVTPFEACH